MSQHEPSENTEDTEEEPETELADPDDYHRRQRLKEIHQARQRVHKTIDSFDQAKRRTDSQQQRRELAYAVSMYVSELESVIEDTDADVTLPDRYPWDDVIGFADSLGVIPDDFDHKANYSPRPNSIEVFRICNRVLAEVKPLIEEDDSDEWEV